MSRALAPANPSFAQFAFHSDFFRSQFSRVAAAKIRSAGFGPWGKIFERAASNGAVIATK
jgi:hypothetical protein